MIILIVPTLRQFRIHWALANLPWGKGQRWDGLWGTDLFLNGMWSSIIGNLSKERSWVRMLITPGKWRLDHLENCPPCCKFSWSSQLFLNCHKPIIPITWWYYINNVLDHFLIIIWHRSLSPVENSVFWKENGPPGLVPLGPASAPTRSRRTKMSIL